MTVNTSTPPTLPSFLVNNNSNSLHRTSRPTGLSSASFVSTTFKKKGLFSGCWRQKDVTRREKVLSVSLVLSCLVIVLLVTCLSFIVFQPQYLYRWMSSSLPWESKCLSPVCVSAAADILKRIDKKVDPCDDFYKFSCGGLDNKLNPIPDDKSMISTASLLQLEIDKRLRGERKNKKSLFVVPCLSWNLSQKLIRIVYHAFLLHFFLI